MILINDTYDLICLICGVIGTALCVYQLYLYDWNIEELMFGHTSDEDEDIEDTKKCVQKGKNRNVIKGIS